MVVRSLDVNKDPFRPRMDDEELLGPEVPYLSAIGALMYLASHTRPDISFSVNLLARYSSCPTRRHWNGVKHILRYLRVTMDMGLYYPNVPKAELIGYADAGYMSTLIMLDHKRAICSHVVIQPFHGVLRNNQLPPHLLIMQRS